VADDRPAETEVEAVSRLGRELEDLKSTVLARVSRMPTGTIEPTLLVTPKADTLFLQGQTLTRAAYPMLWQWIADNALAGTNLPFGIGDGSTTFVLPDARGKALVGATTVDPVGKSFGSASVTLTSAMMPQHNHGGGTTDWSDRSHIHGGNTDNDGGHGGHFPGSSFNAQAGPDLGLAAWNSGGGSRNHAHHFTSATEDEGHKHAFTTGNAGSATPTPFFVVQPSYAVNVLIWT
jgi:microcystin-dependent protein